MDLESHQYFMQQALALAEEAAARGEVPVGAVVCREGEIIGRGSNQRERAQDPVAHAEILAIREAAAAMGSWRLTETVLYVTLEPCPMCAGAIINARIPTVVYGCEDPKAGAVRSMYRLLEDARLNHRSEVVAGIEAERASRLLSEFFARLREMGKK